MSHNFFALVSRMKYIDRWALMKNSREENLCEHSMEVAMIAHALCLIGNVRYGRHLDADTAAVVGLYHDSAEIITGDMPTPVNYYSDRIRDAYRQVEEVAEERLLSKLPDDLRPAYEDIYQGNENEDERYMRRLVKAADKISALIKCMGEENAGNTEFKTAKKTVEEAVEKLAAELPEVGDFVKDFLPPYGRTLDELS